MSVKTVLSRMIPLSGLYMMLIAGPAAAELLRDPPSAAPLAAVAVTPQPWPRIQRLYTNLRPFGKPGVVGVVMDVGYEYIDRVNFGLELSPIALGDSSFNSLAVRAKLGYASKHFGVGITLSSGYPAFFPELGPTVRIGRLDGAYCTLRFAWVINPPVRLPVDAGFELRVPVTRRIAIRADGVGGYASTHPYIVYASAGVSYLLRGQGLTGTTLINLGAGPILFGGTGGTALVGVEHRL